MSTSQYAIRKSTSCTRSCVSTSKVPWTKEIYSEGIQRYSDKEATCHLRDISFDNSRISIVSRIFFIAEWEKDLR